MDEVLLPDDLKQMEALLEAEPSSGPASAGPDIPALREKLAVLVSSGKSKEAIGVQLTHEQVKRLSDKDVEKYTKSTPKGTRRGLKDNREFDRQLHFSFNKSCRNGC